MKIIIMLFLYSNLVYGDDFWSCTEMSSQRNGNIIKTCGIGEGLDENEARLKAFDNAHNEFKRLCDVSSDCSLDSAKVIPKRTSCSLHGKIFKCYRMLLYKLTNFFYKVNSDTKIYQGMSKDKVLEKFGSPDEVQTVNVDGTEVIGFTYKNSNCIKTGCLIAIIEDKVFEWEGFKNR